MVRKLNHYHGFWLNAEHHCRYHKLPYVGEPDDGTIHSYNDIWDGTSKKSSNDFGQKMEVLTGGFERYMNEFFHEAPSVGRIQGCDGSKAVGSKKRGIHYKQKRFGRKMIKALFKIGRRKVITRKEKKALENL